MKLPNIKEKAAKLLVIAVVAMQLLIIVLVIILLDPQQLYKSYQNKQVISKAEKLTDIDNGQTPNIALIVDVDKLKDSNAINKEVYKDSQNDDYVLAYGDKMIIYRKQDNKIIYEGATPSAIANQNQKETQDKLIAQVKKSENYKDSELANPVVQVISNATSLKKQEATFYAKAENEDLVAYFPGISKVFLYRPGTDKIINSANYSTQINK